MRTHLNRLAIVASLGFVTACSSGQADREPPITVVPLSQNKAQLAVGVATLPDGTKGLNLVGTFRQPNGLSATLANTPAVVGPTGFTVPGGGTNAGTGTISGSPQVIPPATTPATTFGTSGGLFAYGFAPENSTQSGAANFTKYLLPFYASTSAKTAEGALTDSTGTIYSFQGGPPAYPNVRTGTFPGGFIGYTLGFTTFAAAPVAGAYNLSLAITAASGATTTITAPAATLNSTTGLGAVTTPVITEDGAGGASIAFTAPAGTTESLVEVYDATQGTYYSILVTGSGAQTAVLPDAVGPVSPKGVAGPTLVAADDYTTTVICADYPLFEAGVPQNTQQTPTLLGAAGQADLSFSANVDTPAY